MGIHLLDGDARRRLERKRVILKASIISFDGIQDVRIRELSPSGVQIWCRDPLEKDGEVIFCRGNIFIAARVVWQHDGSAELEFHRPLDPAQRREIAFSLVSDIPASG